MDFITQIIDVILHLNVHLNTLATVLGPWL